MKNGDKIKIISSHKQKFRKHIGKVGTIMHDANKNEYGVEIKGEWNKCSKKGLFWFKHTELVLETK